MNLPLLLLVDDSEAVLEFERAILAPHYQLATAQDGQAALDQAEALRPAGILLDLTMPKMSGVEVLKILSLDPVLSNIPVVVVTSEAHRIEECLSAGAVDFLTKPIRADGLLSSVTKALETAKARARVGSVEVLPVKMGPHRWAIPLDGVRMVALHPELLPLPSVPSYVTGYFELEGEPVVVLDLKGRLGAAATALPTAPASSNQTLIDRWVVVLKGMATQVALAVDAVDVPLEVLPEHFSSVETFLPSLSESSFPLAGVAKVAGHSLPVINPEAFFRRSLLRKLPPLLVREWGARRGV